MSRIHDALKKAEQERAMNAPPEGVQPAEAPLGGDQRSAVSTSVITESRLTPDPLPGPSESPSTASELRKLVLQRCNRVEWKPDRRTMLLFDRRTPILGLEEFRTLRSRFYLMREQQRLQKVLITSPLPQEGKTFVALNLAQIIVRQPERWVLLIDGDLRSSRSHLYLGAPSTPGVSDYLTGEADEFSVIQKGPVENLFFIPAGKTAPNPGELIANGRFGTLLQRLAPAFDWIIIDSPPVLPVSDAKLMVPACDGVLIVVQAATTPFDLAQKACDEFRDRRLVGVVLNRAEASPAYTSYFYYQSDKATKSSAKNNGRN